jgi:murein DD-endopeptidase MepM/ murein hydrolase activator NlpD
VKHLTVPVALAILASLFAPTAQAPEARAQVIQLAAAPVASPPPPVHSRLLRLARGDTLQGALSEAGLAANEVKAAIEALKPVFPPRQFKAGQEIVLDVAEALQELRFSAAVDRDIVVSRGGDGNFAARVEPRRLTRTTELATGSIRTSLFEAASDAGVPMPVLAEMIRTFSYDVDFQRDLQPNDSFEVLFERLYDERGKPVGTGEIAYAAMTLSGRTIKLYRYLPAGARTAEFFTERGENAKKALLRTPVDGARLSSGFGMRLHPILGYTKMHRGVDFAAPPGAPIMAASDGVVASAGPSGAYGNLVVLRHAGIYETAYAHMSRIARGVKPGTPVRQGEVIGYVGATGSATGPHLHYEVRIKGEPINPVAIKTRPGQALAGKDVVLFPVLAQAVDRQRAALRQAVIVAGTPGGRLDP